MSSRWILFIIAILAGAGLGLLYGWVINPVDYVDTAPDTLRIDYKTDFVLMVAEAYQGESDPVVCVSHADAAAYAEWISRTTGQRYRLPSGPEWREIGAGERIANRPLAEWVGERGLVNSGGNRRPDAARGYADVGFRLVRDL